MQASARTGLSPPLQSWKNPERLTPLMAASSCLPMRFSRRAPTRAHMTRGISLPLSLSPGEKSSSLQLKSPLYPAAARSFSFNLRPIHNKIACSQQLSVDRSWGYARSSIAILKALPSQTSRRLLQRHLSSWFSELSSKQPLAFLQKGTRNSPHPPILQPL